MDLPAHLPFALSLVVLALGPLACAAARLAGPFTAALDGFVFVAIGGLVLLHILPESFALAGGYGLAAAFAGVWLPTLIEGRLRSLARKVHTVSLVFGLLAIAAHGYTDGLALSLPTDPDGHFRMLPMAVVLHRLPEGLAVWFLLRPLIGLPTATAVLGLMAAAMTAGYLSGATVLTAMESSAWGLFQAVIAGSLLHVLLHRSHVVGVGSRPAAAPGYAGLGGLAGFALLWSIGSGHHLGPAVGLARASAPALLAAYVAAGLVQALLPPRTTAGLGRGAPVSQAARGIAFGLPLPMRACSVLPRYRSLVVAGVPATTAMAFLVATPALSLDAVLICLPLLGAQLTVVRVVGAVVVALVTGLVVGRFAAYRGAAGAAAVGPHRLPLGARVRRGLGQGLGEMVDATAPWILLGLALAAAAHVVLGSLGAAILPARFQVEILALLGMPVFVCAAGATPLVAVLLHDGVSPGAALAFLLTGPATSVATLGVLSRLHGRPIALGFAAAIVLLAVALGHAVNGLPLVAAVPDLEPVAARFGWKDASLIAVAILVLASVLRRGPRSFLGELFEAGGAAADPRHDHEHGGGAVASGADRGCRPAAEAVAAAPTPAPG